MQNRTRPSFAKNKIRTIIHGAVVGSIAASAALPVTVQAQGSASAMLEEVTVTARKRSTAEAVQDIPLAINAFGANQLDAMFVKDLGDLGYTMPNVQMEEVGTFPGVQNFSIRGQGINSSIPSVDPTVGTFVDGVYMGVTYGVVMDMFDLSSVEVLRGPQGLLFGRNVTGGAVSVRTALPTPGEELNGKVKVAATDADQYTVAGSLSFPITNNLAGKVVAYYDDDQGYFDNDTDGEPPIAAPVRFKPAKEGDKTGVIETQFLRTSFVWDTTDSLQLILRGEYGEADGSGAAWTSVTSQRDGESAALPGAADRDYDEYATYHDEYGVTDMTWQSLNLEVNWELGNGTLTNLLAWRDLDFFSAADIDAIDTLGIFTVSADTQQDQVSNELRYAGGTDNMQYTLGLYYFQQDIDYREGRPGLAISSLGKPVYLGGSMDHEAWGAFASVDYYLTDRLTLNAGLRYTDEEKDSFVVNGGLNPDGTPSKSCQDPTYDTCFFAPLPGTWDSTTPKLGLTYNLTDDALMYAFWTKGFRSGGVNFRNADFEAIPPGPTEQEEQDSYEIGFKSDLLDGRLRLNGALYYNEIQDMQRELNIANAAVAVLQGTVNAGDATIKGAELDFVALITDNFSINGAIGYTDGGWDKKNPLYDPEVDPSLLATGKFVGDDLPRLAPWTANIGATYDLDLGDAGWMTFRASYAFRDSAAFLDNNDPRSYFDQMQQVNASVDYNSANGNWRVSLYGKNLNDQARWGNLTAASFGMIGPMQKGRLYGAEVVYNF